MSEQGTLGPVGFERAGRREVSNAEIVATVPLQNGVRIAVRGSGTGPVLLFLHGIGGAGAQWAVQIATLSQRYCVLAWDARGYASSAGPPVARFGDFADDLFALLDALGIGRALVVGHSMGGRILLEAARRDQSRFAAMMLSGAQAAYLEHMSPAERQAYVTKREALFAGGAPDPQAARRVADSVLAPSASSEARDAMVGHFMALRREGYLAALAASVGMDARDALPRIAVPTQVVGGVLDPVCPIEETRRIAAAIGQAPAIEFDGVAHMANVEAPALFADTVDRFMSAHTDKATVADAQQLLGPDVR